MIRQRIGIAVTLMVFGLVMGRLSPAQAQGPPTATEIERLFAFSPAARLTEEDRLYDSSPELWARAYENTDTSYYSVTIMAYKQGGLITDARRKEWADRIRKVQTDPAYKKTAEMYKKYRSQPDWKLSDPIQVWHHTDTVISTKDGRTGYYFQMAVIGSLDAVLILPSRDGKTEYMVVLTYTTPHDMPDPNRKRVSRPGKTPDEVLDALETIITRNQNRPARLKPETPDGLDRAAPAPPASP